MVNPKIIYIAVVLVFCFIVYKFKIVPYLAARKILKDAKKNGKSGNVSTGTEAAPIAAQPSGGGFCGSVIPANQLVAAMQSMQSAFPVGMVAAPSGNANCSREMFFDCETFDIHLEDYEYGNDALSIANREAVAARVNDFLLCLRKRGIYPDTLGILPIADGVFMAYVVYTV